MELGSIVDRAEASTRKGHQITSPIIFVCREIDVHRVDREYQTSCKGLVRRTVRENERNEAQIHRYSFHRS